jgi:hypothetical protein
MKVTEPEEADMTEAVTIRYATRSDAAVLRLAALDDRRPPEDPLLLALVEGEPAAAVSLRDGTAVADPFRPSAATLDLLRRRAESELLRQGGFLRGLRDWIGRNGATPAHARPR